MNESDLAGLQHKAYVDMITIGQTTLNPTLLDPVDQVTTKIMAYVLYSLDPTENFICQPELNVEWLTFMFIMTHLLCADANAKCTHMKWMMHQARMNLQSLLNRSVDQCLHHCRLVGTSNTVDHDAHLPAEQSGP